VGRTGRVPIAPLCKNLPPIRSFSILNNGVSHMQIDAVLAAEFYNLNKVRFFAFFPFCTPNEGEGEVGAHFGFAVKPIPNFHIPVH